MFPSGREVAMFAKWKKIDYSVKYYQTGSTDIAWNNNNQNSYWDTVLPGDVQIPVTGNPDPKVFPNSGQNGKWRIKPASVNGSDANFENRPFGLKVGDKAADGTNTALAYYNYTPDTPYANGLLTLGQLISLYYPQGDKYDASLNNITVYELIPGWNAVKEEKFTISFALGSGDTNKGSITGTAIKVDNNGTSKITDALWTGANVSISNTNATDGWTCAADTCLWNYAYTDTSLGSGTNRTLAQIKAMNILGDMTLTPVWTQLTGYSLTFDPGRAGANAAGITTSASPANFTSSVTLSQPTWTGFNFNGWWTSASGGTKIADKGTTSMSYADILKAYYGQNNNNANQYNENNKGPITLYAQWADRLYTVTFTVQGMTGAASGKTNANWTDSFTNNVTAPATTGLAAAGYTFKGWFTSQTGGTEVTFPKAYNTLVSNSENTTTYTVYAQFVEDVVTINIGVADGSTGNVTLSGNGNTDVTSMTLYVGAASGKLYSSASATTPTNSTVAAITPTFASGYSFSAANGWKDATNTNLSTDGANAKITTGGVLTLKKNTTSGLYKAGTYKIVATAGQVYYRVEHYKENLAGNGYDMTATNGQATMGTAVQVAGWGNATATSVNPLNDRGFTYSQSLTNSNGIGLIASLVNATDSGPSCPNVLKIYYTRNSNTVTLEWAGTYPTTVNDSLKVIKTGSLTGTTVANGGSVRYGETVYIPEPPARDGYVFTGWAAKSGSTAATYTAISGTKGQSFTMPDGPIILTGTWRANTYRVNFINDTTQGHAARGSLVSKTGLTVDTNGQKYHADLAMGSKLWPSSSTTVTSAPGVKSANDNDYYFIGWKYTRADGTQVLWSDTDASYLTIDPANFQITTTNLPSGIDGIITIEACWGLVRVISYTAGDHGTFTAVEHTGIKDAADGTSPLLGNYRFNGQTDTNATNARNVGNPKGENGYTFSGWHWQMKNGSGVMTWYSTKSGETGFTYMADPWATTGENPLRVTDSITFIATWDPTIQVVEFVTTDPISGVTGTWTGGSAPTYNANQRQTKAQIKLPETSAYGAPGYTFKWMVKDGVNDGTEYAPGAMYTITPGFLENNQYKIRFVSVFTPVKVTIKYALGTGIAAAAGSVSKTQELVSQNETDSTALNNLGSIATAKDHYTFVGWFTDAACTQKVEGAWLGMGNGVPDTKIIPQKTGTPALFQSATYYAKFVATQYEITFMADEPAHASNPRGSVSVSSKNLYFGNALTGNTVVSAKPGYTHTGWGYYDSSNNWQTLTTSFSNKTVWGDAVFYALYEMRSDYTVKFHDPDNTSGKINNVTKTGYAWTDVCSSKLPSSYDVRPGYTFGGWYLAKNPSDILDAGVTFEEAAKKQSSNGDGAGVNSIDLYAKWIEKTGYTVNYDMGYTGATAPDPKTGLNWTSTQLAAANQTRDGYVFLGWYLNAANPNNDHKVEVTDTYGKLAGGDDTKMSLTLTAHWKQKTFQIKYVDNDGTTQLFHAGASGDTPSVLYWDSIAPMFTPTKEGSTFNGWTYNGNLIYSGTQTTGDQAISSFGSANDPDGHVYVFKAAWRGNPTFTVHYYLVNRNADGTYTAKTAPESTSFNGYLTPSQDADASNLIAAGTTTAVDYWTKFSKAGYEAAKTNMAGVFTNVVFIPGVTIIADSGTDHEFKLYFIEKTYTLKYVDSDGSAFTPAVADKTVGWNSSNLAPEGTAPTKPGYGPVSWTYNGTAVSGKTVSQLLGDANANQTELTLKASWSELSTKIEYAVSGDAGSATLTKTSENIASTTGSVTGSTAKLANAATHKFEGWYYADATGEHQVDSTWVTTNADGSITIVPQKESGLYVARKYFVKVSKLSDESYTVEHFFQQTDGTYAAAPSETNTDSGLENSVVKASDKKVTKQGFTYDAAASGSITSITLIKGDTNRTLKLFYVRDSYDIEVVQSEAGKDAPAPMPSFDNTALSGKKFMGSTVSLPTVGGHDGWILSWKLDNNTTIPATATDFTVPFDHNGDGKIVLTAVWARDLFNVEFSDRHRPDGDARFWVNAQPVQVAYGKNLSSVSGWTWDIDVEIETPEDWALVGWTVYDKAGNKLDSIADPMTYTITQDTIFSAIWAKTLVVTYYPGTHAVETDPSAYQDYKSIDNSPLPSWTSRTGNPSVDAPTAKAGYAWIGWTWQVDGATYNFYKDAASTPAGQTSTAMPTTVDKSYTFTALWKALDRTLTFTIDTTTTSWDASQPAGVTDGDTADVKKIIAATGAIVAGNKMPVANRDGWILTGWKLKGAADGSAIGTDGNFVVPGQTGDTIEFVPVWKVFGMYITYAVSGGNGTRDNREDSVNAEMAAAPGSTATPDAGYKFDGWYKDAACTDRVDASWVTDNGDGTFTIKPVADSGTANNYIWSPKTYYAKFVEGETSLKIEYFEMDTEGSYSNTPSNTTNNVTQTKDGDKIITNQTYGQADFNLTIPTGFMLDATNNGKPTSVTVVGTGASILYVYLERVKNDVTFSFANNPAGVAVPAPKNDVYFGETVNLPTVSTTGYTFAWTAKYVDGSGAEVPVAIANGKLVMPAGAVSVIGTFTTKAYAITFDSTEAGTLDMPNASNTVNFGRYSTDVDWLGTEWIPVDATSGLTHEPTLAGKTFRGWFYRNADAQWAELTDATTFAQIAAGNDAVTTATIWARWVSAEYDAFFKYADADGGSTFRTTTLEWGDTVNAPTTNPTKAGHSFAYWYYMDGDNEIKLSSLSAAQRAYSALAAAQGIASTDLTGCGRGVTFYAAFTKNEAFAIVIYEGEYNAAGQLVATDKEVDSYSNPAWQIGPSSVVTITPDAANEIIKIVLTGEGAQGVTLPKEVDLTTAPGFVFDAAKCNAAGIYTTTDPNYTGILRVVLAPRSDYTVTYVLKVEGGTDRTVKTLSNIAWNKTGLKTAAGTVTAPAGYKIDGDWYYVNGSGSTTSNLDDLKSYGELVKEITNKSNASVKSITIYLNAVPQSYSVIYLDDTNGADAAPATILEKSGFNWNGKVALSDPATLQPGFTKAGYKWMGWEVRNGSNVQKLTGAADALYNALATFLGRSDADIDSPVQLFAIWAKYQPITIELYKDTTDPSNKIEGVELKYTAADEKVLTDGSWSFDAAATSFVNANRPTGYIVPTTLPSIIKAIDGENILRVVYTVTNGYKLTLKTGYGDNDVVATYTYKWNDVVDPKVVAEPERMGWTLNAKPDRWNTAMEGAGTFLNATMTYADLAAAIYGAALKDSAILNSAEGLVLYATWTMANNFQVHYDFNNDKNTNGSIKTDYDENFDPTVSEELKETPVSWNATGFDKDSEHLINGAPAGYEFDHWNTSPDGNGVRVDNAKTYEELSKALSPDAAMDTIKLYAQWRELMVEINYVVDNEDAGTIDRFVDKISAVTKTAQSEGSSPGTQLHSVATAKPGWHFVEWRLVDTNPAVRAQAAVSGTNVMNTLGNDGSELAIDHAADGRLYGATYQAVFARNNDASILYDGNVEEGDEWPVMGAIDPTTTAHGSYVTLSNGKGFNRDHYKLVGWNTRPDGTGVSYKLGQSGVVLPEAGMKLYAQWDLDSHKITVKDPEKGGTLEGPHDTTLEFGEKIPQSFVDSLKPQPRPGWTHTGWSYVITDPITGEKTTGFTTDPTELTVSGDIELTPVFEGADLVDGPPRTGDVPGDNGWLWIVLAAALAMLMAFMVARMRDRVVEAMATCGAHSVGRGAHSVKRSGHGRHSRPKNARRPLTTGKVEPETVTDSVAVEEAPEACSMTETASEPVVEELAPSTSIATEMPSGGAHSVRTADGELVMNGNAPTALRGAHSVRGADGEVAFAETPIKLYGAHSKIRSLDDDVVAPKELLDDASDEATLESERAEVVSFERVQRSTLAHRLIRFGRATARAAAFTAAITLGVAASSMGVMGSPALAFASEARDAALVANAVIEDSSGLSADASAESAGALSDAGSGGTGLENVCTNANTNAAPGSEQGDAASNEHSDGSEKALKGDLEDATPSQDASESDSEASKDDKADEVQSEQGASSADADAAQTSSKDSDTTDISDEKPAKGSDPINDSTHPDNPGTPAGGDVEGNSTVDQPQLGEDLIYTSSGDFIPNAISLTTYDSNAPPDAITGFSDSPLSDGTYFIRWNENPLFWLGEKENSIAFYQGPTKGMPVMWQLTRMADSSYVIQVTGQNVQLYLVRFTDDQGDYVLSFAEAIEPNDANALWHIIESDYDGSTAFLIATPDEDAWLKANEDDEGTPKTPNFGYRTTPPTNRYFFWNIGTPVSQDFEIQYWPNEGTGASMEATPVSAITGGTISTCTFKRFGYNFTGWNTHQDGSGVWYAAGAHIDGDIALAPGFILNLYAQWAEAFVDIIFNATGAGEFQMGDSDEKLSTIYMSVSVLTGALKDTPDAVIESVTALAKQGFHFSSWDLAGGIGEISDFFRFDVTLTAADIIDLARKLDPDTGLAVFQNTTFTATFLANTYTINFDANGGSGSMGPMKVPYGDVNVVTKCDGLKRDGYEFAGWNTQADGNGTKVNGDATVEKLLAAGVLPDTDGAEGTLYAQWVEMNTPPAVDEPSTTTPAASSDGNGGASNATGSYTPYRYRGYTSNAGSTDASKGTGDIPVAEASELLDVKPVFDEKITTAGGTNGGIFGSIGEFLATDTGKIVGIVVGLGIGIALIAGIAALWMHFAGASAAGTTGASTSASAGESRKRKK